MKVSSSTVARRALRALPVQLLVASAVLLPSTAPAPVPVVRAPAQALVAVSATTSSTVVVEHHLLALLPKPGAPAAYGRLDAPLEGVARYQVLRVRFRLHNQGDEAVSVVPLLEQRRAGGTFVPVPEKAQPGSPVHVRREWVRSPSGSGTVLGPRAEHLPTARLLMSDGGSEVRGHRSSAANPDRTVVLPAGTSTEQEFTLGVGVAAEYLTTYEVRLADAGRPLGDDVATVQLGKEPPAQLSPGQRQGKVMRTQRTAPQDSGVRYRLSFQPAAFSPAAVTAGGAATGIHGPYSTTPDQCAVCHRTHTAPGPNLLVEDLPQAALCFTCHDGTGASRDVEAEYAGVPPSNPADRAYYEHDSLTASRHALSSQPELAGVLDRHSECADCHNPHQASGDDATQTATGWTASGRLRGVSGVAVTNGAAGSSPNYTFLNGTATPVTLEYQLCLKCHSGYTVLPSNSGFTPSRFALDKGVELNPSNGSFHPVEAAGTNDTAKMSASLAGSSPYKLWNFSVSSTVRCTQCHASSSARVPAPAPGANLQPHTSANRGILLAPYRDRVLSTAAQPYAAADFALCLLCHGEAPFATETATGTNFFYHGKHVTKLQGMGAGGTDIDTPGAGQGNAVCAECHFRIHSPVTMLDSQSLTGSRLVSFAPDVTGADPSRPRPAWAKIGPTTGSCALTCHGFTHEDESY
jgi:predicted CXXCH cytochrome family protein